LHKQRKVYNDGAGVIDIAQAAAESKKHGVNHRHDSDSKNGMAERAHGQCHYSPPPARRRRERVLQQLQQAPDARIITPHG
jgi:hypothetical protein